LLLDLLLDCLKRYIKRRNRVARSAQYIVDKTILYDTARYHEKSHFENEPFYAGAPFVTCGHSLGTYDWPGSLALVDKMLR